jgi:uncharacterized protein YcbX
MTDAELKNEIKRQVKVVRKHFEDRDMTFTDETIIQIAMEASLAEMETRLTRNLLGSWETE